MKTGFTTMRLSRSLKNLAVGGVRLACARGVSTDR